MIAVGQDFLTLDNFSGILFKKKPITLSASALEKVNVNFQFLQKFSSNKLIYGINTGLGPMAQYLSLIHI